MESEERRFPHGSVRLVRDWRVKTLVPVVFLNLVAFAVLYFLMYHFAISNLVKTRQFGAEIIASELEIHFADLMLDHSGSRLIERFETEASTHGLAALSIFNAEGDAVIAAAMAPRPRDVSAVRAAIDDRDAAMHWEIEEGNRFRIIGSRALINGETCQTCHGDSAGRLGAIQIAIDLTQALNEAADRVRSRFAIAGAAWLGMLGLMFWTGGVVIGRPLRQIERSIAVDGDADGFERDLNQLASRVHQTIWSMIERQRSREENVSRHMARAEQLAALGELAAGLTHEIKNPLAGVIAALELLREQYEEQTEEHEIAGQMLAELRRVTGTVDSLLRLARPQPPRRIESDVRHLARDLVVLFRPRCHRQGIALELETAEHVPAIPLDPGLITQVLVNLITNSIQATPRGGFVRISVAPFPRHDGVLIAVTDSGTGISQDDVERIFDPFFTTKQEGTGLGLAISRQIIEQHNGTMGIESEIGKGTRIVILLPMAAQEMEDDGATALG